MTTLDALFDQAKTQHQSGDLIGALALYQAILDSTPNHAGALQFIGVIAAQQGRFPEAIDFLRQSLAIDNCVAGAWFNLGNCFKAEKNHAAAIDAWQQCLIQDENRDDARLALVPLMMAEGVPLKETIHYLQTKLTPDETNWVWFDLAGVCYTQSGELTTAITFFDRALALGGDPIGLNANKANLLVQSDKISAGEALALSVLAQAPNHRGARSALGWAAFIQGNKSTAQQVFDTLFSENPDDRATRLGWCLINGKNSPEIVKSIIHQWLVDHPNDLAFQELLGNILSDCDQWYEARNHFQTMLAAGFDSLGVRQGLGFLAEQIDGHAAALTIYHEAVSTFPDNRRLKALLGLCHLAVGDAETGWALYENRFGSMRNGPDEPGNGWPLWSPDLANAPDVVVFIEQGIGDTLQFLRFIPLLRAKVSSLSLLIPGHYHALIKQQPILADCLLVDDRANITTAHYGVSLMSLPYQLGLGTKIAAPPYLIANKDRQKFWATRLDNLSGFKIGLNWQGSKTYALDRFRSLPLRYFEPWLDWPDVTFVNLQKGEGHEQIATSRFADRIIDWTAEMDGIGETFVDTAALICGLDLVITSDTAVAHLAGALGVPVWIIVPFCADWRWGIEGDRCPWYDNMRIFRQPERGDWTKVCATIDHSWRHQRLNQQRAEQSLRTQQPADAQHWLDQINPENRDAAWYDLAGITAFQQNDFATAEQCFDTAVTMEPNHLDYRGKLAITLNERGRYRALIDQAVIMKKYHPNAMITRLIESWALFHQGHKAQALTKITDLYHEYPDHAPVAAAAVMIALPQNPHQAILQANRWLEQHPQDITMRLNLAMAMARSYQWDDAIACLAEGLHHHPHHPTLWLDQIRYIGIKDGPIAGLSALNNFIERHPADAHGRLSRAHYRLALGLHEDGWADYQARLALTPPCPSYPLWQGQPLPEGHLLIDFEQGIGDLFQMLRFIPNVRPYAKRLSLRVPERLIEFLKNQPILQNIAVIGTDQHPIADAVAPIMSLPHLLKIGAHVTPNPVAYLQADAACAALWQARLTTLPGRLKIGLNWQGSTAYSEDYLRSLPLSALAPLLACVDLSFVNLHQGTCNTQITNFDWQDQITDWTSDMDGPNRAFVDSAALITNLDLVITSDTALAHLAGALGVPVWLMVSARPDWRWGIDGDKIDWYPRLRLFRQQKLGDWSDVVATICQKVSCFFA